MTSVREPGRLRSLREQLRLPPVPAPFGATLLAALVLFIAVAWPVRVPLFLGIVAAIASRPLFDRLTRAIGGRRAAAAGLMTLFLLALVVLPSIALTTALVAQAHEAVAWAMQALQVDSSDSSWHTGMERAAAKIAETLQIDLDAVQAAIAKGAERLYSRMTDLALVPVAVFGNVIMLCIAHFFFAADGHHVGNYLGRIVPFRPEQTSELLEEFHNVTSGAVWSSICNGVGQGLVVGVGLGVAGIPQPILLGVITAFAALIPIIGSLLVWVPSVIYLAVNGRGLWAAGLAAWCFVMVTVVDNTLKPWVLKGRVEFHGGLLLLGFVGGVGLFGATGLVAGPLVVTFFLTMLRIYQRDYLDQRVVAANSSGAIMPPANMG